MCSFVLFCCLVSAFIIMRIRMILQKWKHNNVIKKNLVSHYRKIIAGKIKMNGI